MKTFKTSGTGSGQSLSEIESERIPIYQTVADAEADLNNLEEGQIVMTPDEGAEELLHPVAVVEKDNTHAVQSGAVANALSYSTTEQKTGGYWIDGKPIYRKCFFRESSGGNWLNNQISSNIDNIVKIEGTAKRLDSTNGTVVNIPSTFGTQTYQISISVAVVPNGVWTFGVEGWGISNFSKIFVIVEYTKTTD